MPRTRRKRKLTEKLHSYPEQDRRQTKIKTETEDDLPAPGVSCCLCKASSGVKLLALFEDGSKRADPTTVDKIKICIGREMSPKTDPAARICCVCLQELDGHHGFWKQALQCNDYAQNQMAADEAEVVDAPTEIRVCRFCLKIGGKLVDLFPEGEASNEHQLGKIRECLAVQMNSWDPVTKICRACIQRIQTFLDFQAKHVSVSIFLKQEHVAGSSYPSNGMLQEEGLNLELIVSDSDCSVEDETKRKDPLTGVKPKPGAILPEIVELLGIDLEGRNFSIVLENGEQLKVAFEGYQFRFHSMNGSGGSLWYCLEAKLRTCRVKLEIDPEGKSASITSKCSTHVHPALPPKLMECPMGKGFVQFGDVNEPFWLFKSRQMGNNQTRSLIFAGYRYFLHNCKNSNPISVWHCGRRAKGHCMAFLEVEGIFQRVQIIGTHNHAVLEQEKIDVVLKACAIDSETTETISDFQKNNQAPSVKRTERKVGITKEQQQRALKSVLKEKNPDIFKVLQEDDPERNFECVNAGSKLKIKKEGFEYRYFGTQEDESTLWKCIMDSLQHCLMIAKLSGDGKHLEMFKGTRHSHTMEPAAIFGYPLGKRMIGDEPLWLLKRISIYFESRYVIYRDYVFILQEATRRRITRWYCLRKQSCKALLIVKGDFEDVCLRRDHSHEKTPQEVLTRLIEGRSLPLSPDENLTFKQRLLSFPSMTGKIWDEVRNEHETFYVLNEVKTGDRIGYGLIFRGFRYSFASLDQYGTSRWVCSKYDVICRVIAVVEGIYESIYIKEEHKHEMMLDSEMDLMIQRSVNTPLSDAAEGSGLVEHSANHNESNNVLSILARQDPERNFSVSRAKGKLMIHFDGDEFRLNTRESDGTSLWRCIWLMLRKCPVVLRLSADGKQVTPVDPEKKHNHSEEQIALFYLACGKAPVYDEYIGTYLSYWLYSCQSEYRTNRAIIYQGYKYYLHFIGNNGMSSWKCYLQKCNAFVRVEDCLKAISCKNKHTHDPLSNEEILAITGLTEVDKDLLLDTSNLESDVVPANENPLRPLTLLRLLSRNDSDRNFQVSIDKEKMKISQNGYEYFYQSSNETHSLWKCIYSFIRRCRAVLHVDTHCRQGFLPKIPKHNHPDDMWGILCYPLGKSSIMDSYTETMKPFWFLMQSGFLRTYPILIYDQNKFHLTFITENGDSSKWRCAGQGCPATLTVTGLFELIVATGSPHNHEPPSEEKVATWMRIYGGGAADGECEEDDEYGNQIPFVEVPMDNDDSPKFEEL